MKQKTSIRLDEDNRVALDAYAAYAPFKLSLSSKANTAIRVGLGTMSKKNLVWITPKRKR